MPKVGPISQDTEQLSTKTAMPLESPRIDSTETVTGDPLKAPKRGLEASRGLAGGGVGNEGKGIAESLAHLIVPVAGLKLDPDNARLHNTKNLDAIKQSLTLFGQVKPIVVRRSTNVVIAGNGTLEAARSLGWKTIAVSYVDMSDIEAMSYGLADNRTSELGTWDFEVVARQQKYIEEFQGPERVVGYTPNEMRVICGELDGTQNWQELWQGPYTQEDVKPFDSINVQFADEDDRKNFLLLLGENPERRKSIWFPHRDYLKQSIKPSESNGQVKVTPGRYPIYIPSKGRWESRLTSKSLESLGLPYFIVVEREEYNNYAAVIAREKILTLPFSGKGLVSSRNWIMEHSIQSGSTRHWQIDDNIDGFYRLENNLKRRIYDANPFIEAEEFTDRFDNVAISGLNYEFFADRRAAVPPFILNTRVYSCSLINNAISHRWRAIYNDDTDICLRVLKDGWCTILFNSVLCKKSPTMKLEGGNTPIYQDDGNEDGRLKMAQSLQRQHPDVVTITRKWGRWQHHVDYSGFKGNRLRERL